MPDKPGVHKVTDRMPEIMQKLDELTRYGLEVGVLDDSVHADSDLTNAQIGYINETGAPELNIPARPHLVPGVKESIPSIEQSLNRAFAAIFAGREAPADATRVAFEEAGEAAVYSIHRKIASGLSPQLAPLTLALRALKGGSASTLPLLFTGEYAASIKSRVTYKGR